MAAQAQELLLRLSLDGFWPSTCVAYKSSLQSEADIRNVVCNQLFSPLQAAQRLLGVLNVDSGRLVAYGAILDVKARPEKTMTVRPGIQPLTRSGLDNSPPVEYRAVRI